MQCSFQQLSPKSQLGAGAFGAVQRVQDSAGEEWSGKTWLQSGDVGVPHATISALRAANLASGTAGLGTPKAVASQRGQLCTLSTAGVCDLAHVLACVVDGSLPPLPVPAAEAIMWGVLRALSQCHDSGMAHRDVKPANIILLEEGTVQLIDWDCMKCTQSSAPAMPSVVQPLTITPGGYAVAAMHPDIAEEALACIVPGEASLGSPVRFGDALDIAAAGESCDAFMDDEVSASGMMLRIRDSAKPPRVFRHIEVADSPASPVACPALDTVAIAESRLGFAYDQPQVGTVEYRAPEISLGAGPHTHAVDVWSAALVLIDVLRAVDWDGEGTCWFLQPGNATRSGGPPTVLQGERDIPLLNCIARLLGHPPAAWAAGRASLAMGAIKPLAADPAGLDSVLPNGTPPAWRSIVEAALQWDPAARPTSATLQDWAREACANQPSKLCAWLEAHRAVLGGAVARCNSTEFAPGAAASAVLATPEPWLVTRLQPLELVEPNLQPNHVGASPSRAGEKRRRTPSFAETKSSTSPVRLTPMVRRIGGTPSSATSVRSPLTALQALQVRRKSLAVPLRL